ncbi:MAG: preprotein translocase subunit SecE [Patescibacteria group bacterium]|nr:preprotein translocase subunit SecE [Patescibacteria group bacterium]
MKLLNKINKTLKTLSLEYKQVKWPSAKQTINYTILVLAVSAIIMLAIIGLDALFFELRARFIII